MQKIKSLAAVFLALFILAAIPTQAFAAESCHNAYPSVAS